MWFLTYAACHHGLTPRPLPLEPPPDAVWTGGLSGGSWQRCQLFEGSRERYRCTVWTDSGRLWAQGEYVLRRAQWNEEDGYQRVTYLSVGPPPAEPPYAFTFEGTVLELEDQQLLLPDGWVIYPSGGNSGQCVLFAEGEVQRKISYEAPLERCPPEG